MVERTGCIRGGTYTSFSVASTDASCDYYHNINKSGISYLPYPGDPRPVFDFSNVNPGTRRTCAFNVVGGNNTFGGFDVTGIRAGNHPRWTPGGSAAPATPTASGCHAEGAG